MMNRPEFEAALRTAFSQCEVAGYPLNQQQQQILAQALQPWFTPNEPADGTPIANPLDELTPEQRQVFLQFVQAQNRLNIPWKIQLLNDWLQGKDSGAMQFVRELYGPQWLERVQPIHIARYADEAAMVLQMGNRIEVANSLWEWVQDDGPCALEWFPCTVTALSQAPADMPMVPDSYSSYTTCTVRFDSGVEYEIQGVYEWNRYSWRWPEE